MTEAKSPYKEQIHQKKKALRAKINEILKSMDEDERQERSQRAAGIFISKDAYRDAGIVLAFLSMAKEVDTGSLVDDAHKKGKLVGVPKIDGKEMVFIELTEDWKSWPRDRWDIPEPPADSRLLLPEEIALSNTVSIIPGLAFDRNGGRLGRGKAYYDRWLARLDAARELAVEAGKQVGYHKAIALGYSSQLVDSVPMDSHDVFLDDLALG